METDKVPANKFLQIVMDADDTDTDNSALYCTAVSNVSNDDSTLELDGDISLENTMEKTVKHTKIPNLLNTPALKRVANSPLLLSGRKQFLKHHASSSTPNLIPDRTRGTENDINVVNKGNWSKFTIDLTNDDSGKGDQMEVVNKKLEQIKLELPMKANWRFTSPSNPAYCNSETDESTKEPSPGQIQFQKTVTQVNMDYDEDINLVEPPLTGRPSMAIDDFEQMKQLFKVKTPAKQPMIIETDTESDISPMEIRPPKTLEQVFENMAAGMANSSIDEMCAKEEALCVLKKEPQPR